MKGRNSTVVCFRISDDSYERISEKACRKELTAGEYCKQLVLKEALRIHKRKEER